VLTRKLKQAREQIMEKIALHSKQIRLRK